MRPRGSSRSLIVALVALGVFVLAQILLLSWLIFQSLSQREVERALLETRVEAKDLAERIARRAGIEDAENRDLLLILAHEREIQQFIDGDLARRDLVENVEIFDVDGSLIYRSPDKTESAAEAPDRPRELPAEALAQPIGAATEPGFVVSEAIGKLGTLRIGLSPTKVRQRAEVLRQDLVRQASRIAVVSLLVLVSAYFVIGILARRARRLEERARQADRMAYVGTLAAGLAHEIRSPLNSLNLNMQMLEEDLGSSSGGTTNRRLFQITHQEIRRLERLVTDFLLFAKPRPLDRVEMSPAALLERVRDVLSGEIRARGALVSIVDQAAGVKVKVDVEQITQLLLNLVQNALAATEGTQRSSAITLRAAVRGDRALLEVEDNGVGIAEEEQRRIFDAFYSTRKGGTGLGLAVVERIAQAHGAELSLDSRPGEGTKVTVSLPVETMPARKASPTREMTITRA
ncbi:MAG TPA: ATP-binding protein [Thermoanaerobaculia bacterium]|nr:ATP-binding protein [Thermoanaerobaculia bacterium]